ncbi:DUF6701 domain-containing protein [Massilia sp. LXY-6]|uniref:DUF6701 domain-containing protein n=1 Tax=Massilia sp. LXY-6 TaxID=3379823 RepID=UPI003EE39954
MRQRFASRWLALFVGVLLLAGGLPARADAPVSLFQSLRGNLNFTGTEETQRNKDDSKSCSVSNPNKKLSASLSGIPSGATIKSAQLYWAGSGATPDYTVSLDGVSVTATAKRQYIAKPSSNGITYAYFSGAADVTAQVAKKGNGTYTFNDLTVDNGEPWCSAHTVLAGFALVVVYAHPNEPFRMLNLYEGFQAFQNNGVTIDLGDFNVPNPLPANVTGRVGHITWEGDAVLSQGGEDLLFNGHQLSDAINPAGNQFNSASNVTGDTRSYGIDFDVYTLAPPLIQPGQTTASSTYRSGQDLVLLGAEIVAMPYVGNADLSLAMTRTGDLTVGSSTNYTLSVTNGGLDDEIGPVTIVDTLPAGLNLISAGGAGWTCSTVQSNGQTIVTCTQPGPLKPGARMSPLVIAVTPTAAANYTNTATVSGKTGDNNSANNTASNSATAADSSSAAFVFTSEACTDGQKIVTSPQETGCHRFIGPVVAAAQNTAVYITAVKSGQIASKMQDTDYPLSLDFRFACLPNSGVAIAYAGRTDFDCGGTWRTVGAKLPAGKPSAVLAGGAALAPLFYADTGRVSLTLRWNGAIVGTVDFISKPADIRFQRVFRADGTDDYMGTAGDNWLKDERYGFARAGDPFTMRVGALMANNQFAPSFGKEPVELTGVLPDDTIDLDLRLDLFLLNPKVSPKLAIDDKTGVVVDAFAFDQPFARNAGVAGFGAMDAQVRWYEAGNVAATPYLIDYLGTGQVGGPPGDVGVYPEKRVVNGTHVIGRFYPDHFVTDVNANFNCLPAMNCPAVSSDPAKPTFPVSGVAYSRQPFSYTVTPYGVPRNGEPTLLSLFQNDSARPVTLTAAKAPNDAATPATGSLTAAAMPTSTGPTDFPQLKGAASYSTGNPYNPATAVSRSAGDWGAPTLVYLRASMTETILPGGSANPVITSRIPAGTWTPQNEDGLLVVAGRLFVPNVFGTDLLRLPVPLAAQYWNASAWAASASDEAGLVASAIRPLSNGCRKFFAQDGKSGACTANPLTVAGAVPLALTHGKATLMLQAPPRGTVGSVDYTLDSADAPWLPSTQARATFGLYKSPLIYLRELY